MLVFNTPTGKSHAQHTHTHKMQSQCASLHVSFFAFLKTKPSQASGFGSLRVDWHGTLSSQRGPALPHPVGPAALSLLEGTKVVHKWLLPLLLPGFPMAFRNRKLCRMIAKRIFPQHFTRGPWNTHKVADRAGCRQLDQNSSSLPVPLAWSPHELVWPIQCERRVNVGAVPWAPQQPPANINRLQCSLSLFILSS